MFNEVPALTCQPPWPFANTIRNELIRVDYRPQANPQPPHADRAAKLSAMKAAGDALE